ncbi:MAG: hypothetical protein AAFO85_16350, partial [Cyanobacteria bacterium J06598_4]
QPMVEIPLPKIISNSAIRKGGATIGCLLDLAEESDIVVRKGAWYSYKGDNVGQGRDNTINYLLENPEIAAEIEAKVRDELKPKEEEVATPAAEVDKDAEE